MQQLSTAIAAGASSGSFKTSRQGSVWFDVFSTTASQTATIEYSFDNTTFRTLRADGSNQTVTTNDLKVFSLPGGTWFRVTADGGNGGTIDVRVEGPISLL